MSTSATARGARFPASGRSSAAPLLTAARPHFASAIAQSLPTARGVIRLLGGGLKFQSLMYSKCFIQMLTGMTAGQRSWPATAGASS